MNITNQIYSLTVALVFNFDHNKNLNPKKNRVLKMMFCNLPKNLYSQIPLKLELETLSTTLMVAKTCYDRSDEMWRLKTMREFPLLKEQRPANITSYDWYKRLVTSGDLYWFSNFGILATDVIKCFLDGKSLYYIDISNDLYQVDYPGTILSTEVSFQMANVQDMIIGGSVYGPIVAFLTLDGELLLEKDDDVMTVNMDVKKLFGYSKLSGDILILTEDDDLYSINFFSSELKNIASNVRSANWATISYEEIARDFQAIYYTNQDGELWEYYPLYSRSAYEVEYEYNELIAVDCKSIHVTDNYLLILLSTDHLQIYPRSEFHPHESRDIHGFQPTTEDKESAQIWYQHIQFKHISTVLDMVYLVDTKHNFYMVQENSLWKTPLTVRDINVILPSIDSENTNTVYLIKYRK